jgi:hypothetical protein
MWSRAQGNESERSRRQAQRAPFCFNSEKLSLAKFRNQNHTIKSMILVHFFVWKAPSLLARYALDQFLATSSAEGSLTI